MLTGTAGDVLPPEPVAWSQPGCFCGCARGRHAFIPTPGRRWGHDDSEVDGRGTYLPEGT